MRWSRNAVRQRRAVVTTTRVRATAQKRAKASASQLCMASDTFHMSNVTAKMNASLARSHAIIQVSAARLGRLSHDRGYGSVVSQSSTESITRLGQLFAGIAPLPTM